MEDRDHQESPTLFTVVDAVREPMHQPLTHLLEDTGMPPRILRSGIQDLLHRRRELRPQPGATILILARRLVVFESGLPAEDHRPSHHL